MLLTCAQRTSVRMRLKSSLEAGEFAHRAGSGMHHHAFQRLDNGQALACRRCALDLKIAAAVIEELGEPCLLTLARQRVLPVCLAAARGMAVNGSVRIQQFRRGDSNHAARRSPSRGCAE